MSAQVLRVDEPADGVAVLTLSRPERLNALSAALADQLADELVARATDDRTRVVVLTGAGERAFGAGIDVRELAEGSVEQRDRHQAAMLRLQRTLADGALPVVAAVRGIAVGASFQLLLHSDLVVVGRSGRLAMRELAAGMPAILGGWLLHQRVGAQVAADLVLTGRWVGAEEAVRLGLAARVVADGDELDTAVSLAAAIAALPADALRATHGWLRRLRSTGAPATFAGAVDAADDILHAANRRAIAPAGEARSGGAR
ncbi:enoyl-CoA hydratase/isomerase family protein [Nocardioides carbamazepini]|uniref:enoyl-CoA hydratase/isomerase family protein n=1 Tax=Nocardioides carbamazepini TaxID=2854259 RepID=UPI00214A81C7|nr:enoyl-CoA hydratase/isomerase family protein [Nocardioides carbamazepini]MCR1785828.1 enoyl-CoA hydratase/isomerase family protein [Nocardioides carbamazepini]